jgi:hypothetical protein
MRAERLLETAIYGHDLTALEQFCVELLGLEPVARTPGCNVVLRCGTTVALERTRLSPGGSHPSRRLTISGAGSTHG